MAEPVSPPRDDHDDGHDHRPGRVHEHRLQLVQHRADRGHRPVEDAGALHRQPVEAPVQPNGHRRVPALLLHREVGDPGFEPRRDLPDGEPVEGERHDGQPQQGAEAGPRPAQARCGSGRVRPPTAGRRCCRAPCGAGTAPCAGTPCRCGRRAASEAPPRPAPARPVRALRCGRRWTFPIPAASATRPRYNVEYAGTGTRKGLRRELA